ncbi:MAG: hypothetical protein LQ340_001394 [Diploschistes diacapsis]|nr:MAG: hypothetical protein LQ340_001394 [Diploschistes diacapsis]
MAFFSFDVSGLSQSHGALASLLVQGSPDKHLTESVDAVSLAFMAHHNRQLPFDRLARAKYIEAIRQINKVLKSPHLATADTTLQSVLLLDLYEKLVNRDQLDASAWIAHVNGAVALVKARGTRNVSSHTARQLAWRLITMTIIGCAVVSMRILDALLELRQNFRPFYLENDNKWRIAELCFNLVDLKADISEGRLITKTDILGAGWALESRFAAMQEELLLSWVDDPPVLADHYDLDQDHFVTQGANVFRTMRDLSQINPASPPSCEIIEASLREICASAPQFFLAGARPGNELPFSLSQIQQCYALLPPLYMASQLSKDPKVRAWVIGIMHHMAKAGMWEWREESPRF